MHLFDIHLPATTKFYFIELCRVVSNPASRCGSPLNGLGRKVHVLSCRLTSHPRGCPIEDRHPHQPHSYWLHARLHVRGRSLARTDVLFIPHSISFENIVLCPLSSDQHPSLLPSLRERPVRGHSLEELRRRQVRTARPSPTVACIDF